MEHVSSRTALRSHVNDRCSDRLCERDSREFVTERFRNYYSLRRVARSRSSRWYRRVRRYVVQRLFAPTTNNFALRSHDLAEFRYTKQPRPILRPNQFFSTARNKVKKQ